MVPILVHLINQHATFIGNKSVQPSMQLYYVKWLRYYFDFCHKCDFQQDAKEKLQTTSFKAM
jgi:hypothetical protein